MPLRWLIERVPDKQPVRRRTLGCVTETRTPIRTRLLS